jgi:hypothetical protein
MRCSLETAPSEAFVLCIFELSKITTLMKRHILFLILLLSYNSSFSQWSWQLHFENEVGGRVKIDTSSNPNNVWKIGHPDKTIFNTSHSNPNVIVTDTANPYPINDTSSFAIIHYATGGWPNTYPGVDISGWYSVNSDTLTDYGFFDFSPNHGNTWYPIGPHHGCCSWFGPEEIPTFTGNSFGWKHFHYCICPPMPAFDSVFYRFTFISDGIQTNKDGLMFDDFRFEDVIEGVDEIGSDNWISISPNPAHASFTTNLTGQLSIYDVTGRLVQQQIVNDKQETVNCKLNAGIYFVKMSGRERICTQKLVIE